MKRDAETPESARKVRRRKTARDGGWGCPHDDRGTCLRRAAPCEPLALGCVLCDRKERP